MPATVNILEWNGAAASPTKTSKTSATVRFKKADNATVDSNNPLVKPASGFDRSMEKWLRLAIGATAPTGSITNPQFYTDGAGYGTGITALARTTNAGVYAAPAIPADDTTNATSDLFTFTSAARKDMDAVNAGPFSTANTDIGDFLVCYLRIDNTVTAPATLAAETLTFTYDET